MNRRPYPWAPLPRRYPHLTLAIWILGPLAAGAAWALIS